MFEKLQNIQRGQQGRLLQFLTFTLVLVLVVLFWKAIFLFDSLQRLNRLHLDDVLYRWRGPVAADTNIVIVAVDDETSKELSFPVPRRYYAELIAVLQTLGARTIAFDFLFNDRTFSLDDSLLATASDTNTVIHGLDLISSATSEILPLEDDQLIPCQGMPIDSATSQYPSANRIVFPYFKNLDRYFQRLGHFAMLIDVDGHLRHIPLVMKYGDCLYPSLGLKTYLHAFDLEKARLQVEKHQFKIQYAVLPAIKVTTSEPGVMMLNFYGDMSAFENYYSMIGLLRLGWEESLDSLRASGYQPFAGKIVLIGNTMTGSGDVFLTPFDTQFPGVGMHATAVANLIKREWLVPLVGWKWFTTELVLLALFGATAFFGYKKRRKRNSLLMGGMFGGIFLLFVNVGAFLAFLEFHLVGGWVEWNLAAIFMAAIGWGLDYLEVRDKGVATQRKLEATQRELEEAREINSAQHILIDIRILFVKLDKGYVVAHFIEKIFSGKEEPLRELKIGQQNQLARHVEEKIVNSLRSNLKKLYGTFEMSCPSGKIETSGVNATLCGDLRFLGKIIYESFGLIGTYNQLFDANETNVYLRFLVSDGSIPWHLAYRPADGLTKGVFLAEQYPLSLKFDFVNPITRGDLQDKGPHAILMGPAYAPDLPENMGLLEHLRNVLKPKLHRAPLINRTCDEALSAFRVLQNRNLRLIHFSGHCEHQRLSFGEEGFLGADNIRNDSDPWFLSHPIIFVNACISGSPDKADKWNSGESLTIEFLRRGAGACIVTLFKVPDGPSAMFAKAFYEHLLDRGETIGMALLAARKHLDQSGILKDYDPKNNLTRYAYVIYGDPTIKFYK